MHALWSVLAMWHTGMVFLGKDVDRMFCRRPRKCGYGIPSHFQPELLTCLLLTGLANWFVSLISILLFVGPASNAQVHLCDDQETYTRKSTTADTSHNTVEVIANCIM